MSDFLTKTIQRAAADPQTIILPEGSDQRTIDAAAKVAEQGIAHLIVVSRNPLPDLEALGIEVVDPGAYPHSEEMAQELFQLRQAKGMTLEQAQDLVKGDELYFGVMMVKMGFADGMVAGACHATSDVLRPALQILKTAPGTKLVSAFFVMVVPDCELGEQGVFVFSDCGLNLYPDADELSEIAIASAASFKSLVEAEPRVAMLSYSSMGSGKGDSPAKVIEATGLVREKAPGLAVDGELQLDAAIVESVGASKAPGSTVAGKANVLIFPNLDAGNIGYKLVQRLAKAEAYGPVLQGIARPVNDLSRGCSAEDILGVVAITAVQSQVRKAVQGD